MSDPSWNYPKHDENLIKPEIQQAVILIHGRTDVVSERVAMDNKHALYLWDRNGPQDQMKNSGVRDRDIVYVFIGSKTGLDDLQRQHITGEQSLAALSSLLGQGEQGNKEELRSQIMPVGFCNNGNKFNNTDRFNIQIGGTLTVRNNGPNTIYAGNYVYADLPNENAPYINGENRKELILKPYDPTIHKNTTKSIRLCLDKSNDTSSSYNDKFVNHCHQMLYSLIDMLLLNMIAISTGMLFGNQPDNSGKLQLFNAFNELNNKIKEIQNKGGVNPDEKMAEIMREVDAFRKILRNQDEMKSLFFPKTDENLNTENSFHKLHHAVMGELLIKQADLLNYQLNWTMGKAITTAAPGKDFTINIGRHGI